MPGVPTTGVLYVARAAVLTVAVVGLACAAHVIGGGGVPSPWLVAALAGVTGWVCAWVARCRLRWPAVLGLLTVGQVTLHESLTYFAAPGCGAGVPAGGHAGHSAGTTHCDVAASALGLAAHESRSLAMLAAHAAATVVLTLIVARGERAVWAVASWLSPLIPFLLLVAAPLVLARPRRQPRALGVPWRPTRHVLLRVSPRRGPPVWSRLLDVVA